MRKTLKYGISAIAALLLFGGAVQAAEITQTQNSFGSTFTFAGFDGGLGTLYDVELDWTLSANFSGNDPGNFCTVHKDCEGNIRLELDVVGGALGPIDSDVSQFISNPEVDAGFNETLNNNGSVHFVTGLSAFVSPNPIGDFTVSSFATGDLNNPWVHLFTGDPTGSVTLTYMYGETTSIAPTQYVPEPGTLAILGVGIAGLGFARRRKAA